MLNVTSAPVVVIAPDSFKGSLSAEGVANAIAEGIMRARPDADIRIRPMADGDEGTLDAMFAAGGERRLLNMRGAAAARRDVATGLLAAGGDIIETAEVVGITDPEGMAVPVTKRSTLGMGEAIRSLLDSGARTFYVALGGSSTNNGGAGLLVGLGLKLLDAAGKELDPVPSALARIARIDVSGLDPRVKEAVFVGMSDVDNPLTGDHGATAVFGPQKGVTHRSRSRRSTPPSPISPMCWNRRWASSGATSRAPARRADWASRCTCSARASRQARKSSRAKSGSTPRSKARTGSSRAKAGRTCRRCMARRPSSPASTRARRACRRRSCRAP